MKRPTLRDLERVYGPLTRRIETQDNAATSHPYFIVYEGSPRKPPKWWRFVHAFLTRKNAEEYIERHAHDLRRPFIYVASAHDNREIRVARVAPSIILELVAEVRRLRKRRRVNREDCMNCAALRQMNTVTPCEAHR